MAAKTTSGPTDAGSRASPASSGGSRRRAARLCAVQALYQIELSGTAPEAVLTEFLDHRLGEVIEGLKVDQADRDLLGALVREGAAETAALDDILSAVLAEDWPVERLETLLKVILRSGAFELAYRPDIPARVVIAEYVNLAEGFFERKETGMANGVLDALARHLRPEEFESGEPTSQLN